MRSIFAIGLTMLGVFAAIAPAGAQSGNSNWTGPVYVKVCFVNQTVHTGEAGFRYNSTFFQRDGSWASTVAAGETRCSDAVSPADLIATLTVSGTTCRVTRNGPVTDTVTVTAATAMFKIACPA